MLTVRLGVAISIHAPARGATALPRGKLAEVMLFQSTPPARGATLDAKRQLSEWIFQSTPPARGATRPSTTAMRPLEFQSTPPARGATFSAEL